MCCIYLILNITVPTGNASGISHSGHRPYLLKDIENQPYLPKISQTPPHHTGTQYRPLYTPKNFRLRRYLEYYMYCFCAKRLLRSPGPPGASVRPPPCAAAARRRAPASGQISKCPKNGPPETDLRAEIPGSRVPFLVHFWDLTKYVS